MPTAIGVGAACLALALSALALDQDTQIGSSAEVLVEVWSFFAICDRVDWQPRHRCLLLPLLPWYYLQEFPFALITDLDHSSRHPSKLQWHSVMKSGVLSRTSTGSYTVRSVPARAALHLYQIKFNDIFRWTNEVSLKSRIAVDNRSMELSEIVKFGDKLLAMCDKTGIIFEILPNGNAMQRWAVPDGESFSFLSIANSAAAL